MRAVLFIFDMLETIFNMFCIAYHIHGFMAINVPAYTLKDHVLQYIYLSLFYAFTVLTLFASVNLCTGLKVPVVEEIIKNTLAFLGFIYVSIMTMRDAEVGFHLMYLSASGSGEVFRFFSYLRDQSIAALCCSVIYLLHATLMIDVYLTGGVYYSSNDEKSTHSIGSDSESEDLEYLPIRLYVFGEYIESYFYKYEWFRMFAYDYEFRL